MRRGILLIGAAALAVSGCTVSTAPPSATTTVTVTATVTARPLPRLTLPPITTGTDRPTTAPPRLRLSVFDDGCGVIRSEAPPGTYESLTWVFRDRDGFQVLGRNAEGETRYRYFRPGAYSVVLEAFGSSHYVPVSNTVTVHC
jgi:hypothetical protein